MIIDSLVRVCEPLLPVVPFPTVRFSLLFQRAGLVSPLETLFSMEVDLGLSSERPSIRSGASLTDARKYACCSYPRSNFPKIVLPNLA
jgi:hypothetical protein